MKKFLIYLINCYKKYVSPYTKSCCRFTPTCSQYAIESIERFGCLVGSYYAILRILRCNPFCKGGYDPVKQKNG